MPSRIPLRDRLSLSPLTGGAIPYDSFENFIRAKGPGAAKEMVEKFLGFQIPDGGVQPMFDSQGTPLRYRATEPGELGEQICLPWTWTSCLTAAILKKAGISDDVRGPAIAHLPVPFWEPTDILLVTADGFFVNAIRSHMIENGNGQAFAAAAGSQLASDGGAKGYAKRALREAMGIDWDAEAARVEELPLITNRSVQSYTVSIIDANDNPAKAQGKCPAVGCTFVVQTRKTLAELSPLIELDKKWAGVVAVHADELAHLRDHLGETVPAQFALSQAIADQWSASVTTRQSLAVLRKVLLPPSNVEPLAGKHGLASLAGFKLSLEDIDPGSKENLNKMLAGAAKLGLIPEARGAAILRRKPGHFTPE